MEYLIDWGCVYPPRYYREGSRAPLGCLRAALRAIVVTYI
jgi:hypothetical protein